MAVFSSPADLCRSLNLAPEPGQFELMERLADARGLTDVELHWPDDGGETLRAILMVVLWRTLRTPRTRATILAPSEGPAVAAGELGRTSMAWLSEVCATRDEGLRGATRFSSWNHLEFGSEPGWELRMVPNVPFIARTSALVSSVGLILGAGEPQTALAEASKAFEDAFDVKSGVLIRAW